MNARTLEHRAVVQRVDGGKATVAMNPAACGSCGGGGCGIGKMAGARAATLLTLPVSGAIRAGDVVIVALPESRLTMAAIFGYLAPVLAMLLGAGTGATLDGGDAATALGALAGFVVALAGGRLIIGRTPQLLPSPELIRLVHGAGLPRLSSQEFDNER